MSAEMVPPSSQGACKLSPLPPIASSEERECLASPPWCFCILRNSLPGSSGPSPPCQTQALLGGASSLQLCSRSSELPSGDQKVETDLGSNLYSTPCWLGNRDMSCSSMSLSFLICPMGMLSLSGLPWPCRGGRRAGFPISGLRDKCGCQTLPAFPAQLWGLGRVTQSSESQFLQWSC